VDDKSPGLVVTRNGMKLDPLTWGVAVPVDPGELVIEAAAPAKVTWRTTVRAEGAGKVLPVRVPALMDEVVPEVPFWQRQRVSMGLLGGAVVLAGAGAGFGAWAVATHSTVPTECAGQGVSSCGALAATQTQANVATGLFVGAGVAAAAGVVFVAVERHRKAPVVGPATAMPVGVAVRF
jgi:hypothetical protein